MSSPAINIIRLTDEDGLTELEAIYAEHPTLREHRRECCGGCCESDLASRHGWGHPILDAWHRVETLRFLLGQD